MASWFTSRFIRNALKITGGRTITSSRSRSSISNSTIYESLKNTQRNKLPFPGINQTEQPKYLLRMGLLGFLGCAAYYWNLERVPYTNRSRFVIASTDFEKFMYRNVIEHYYQGKAAAATRKEEIPEFEWEFVVVDLPNHRPECLSGGKIVLFTGLLDTLESDVKIAADIAHEVGHAIGRHGPEVLSKLAVSNSFLCWTMNLHLLPALSTILAKWRACTGRVSVLLYPAITLFLYWKANLSLIPAISKFLIVLPNCRRQEFEADYIGVILMAGAGYDPRVYVEDMRMRDDTKNYGGGWPFGEYARTHPSNKKRAQQLSQSKVMEEALSLYEEVLMQRDGD